MGKFVLYSTDLNPTIPEIVLSETVLSGDPLYQLIVYDSFAHPKLK